MNNNPKIRENGFLIEEEWVESWVVNDYFVAVKWNPFSANGILVQNGVDRILYWPGYTRIEKKFDDTLFLLNVAIELCLTNGIQYAPKTYKDPKIKKCPEEWYNNPPFLEFANRHYKQHIFNLNLKDYREIMDLIKINWYAKIKNHKNEKVDKNILKKILKK